MKRDPVSLAACVAGLKTLPLAARISALEKWRRALDETLATATAQREDALSRRKCVCCGAGFRVGGGRKSGAKRLGARFCSTRCRLTWNNAKKVAAYHARKEPA